MEKNGTYQIRHREQHRPLQPYYLLETARDHAIRMSGIVDWEYEVWVWNENDADYRYLETWDRRTVFAGQKPTVWHYYHGVTTKEILACAPDIFQE